jgi:putative tricarboxylic transport membrane protein
MNDATRQARSPSDRARQEETRAKAMGHIVLNVTLAILFIFLFLRAGSLPSSMWEPLGSGSFPRMVLAALVLFNALIVATEVRHFIATPALPAKALTGWCYQHRLAFGVLGLFALFIIVVPIVGFRWSSLPFLVACQYLLGARHLRGFLVAIAVAFVMSFGIEALFRDVFTISLPRGLWN